MSDEQLVTWLREDSEEHRQFFPSDTSYFRMHQQAADRIQQLIAERDEALAEVEQFQEAIREALSMSGDEYTGNPRKDINTIVSS